MSYEFDGPNGLHRWSCDGEGCHRNYESETKNFKSGFEEAKSEGWIAVAQYPKGIIQWEHYCPKCAEEL